MELLAFKLLGGCCIVAAGAGMGAYPVQKMNLRAKELEELYYCLLRLKSELCFGNTMLADAFWEAAKLRKNKNGVYARALEHLSEKMKEGNRGYAELLEETKEVFQNSTVTQPEQERFLGVLEQLSGADRERQGQVLTYYAAQIQEGFTEVKERKKTRSYLYRSLGILGGIFLSVLLF